MFTLNDCCMSCYVAYSSYFLLLYNVALSHASTVNNRKFLLSFLENVPSILHQKWIYCHFLHIIFKQHSIADFVFFLKKNIFVSVFIIFMSNCTFFGLNIIEELFIFDYVKLFENMLLTLFISMQLNDDYYFCLNWAYSFLWGTLNLYQFSLLIITIYIYI